LDEAEKLAPINTKRLHGIFFRRIKGADKGIQRAAIKAAMSKGGGNRGRKRPL
jgi:hypothetical protein